MLNASMIVNPYYSEFLKFALKVKQANEIPAKESNHGKLWYNAYAEMHSARRDLITHYSYAIPDPGALELIAKYGPILELGAGKGYWASLLRQMSVDILAYDIDPKNGSGYIDGGKAFTFVDTGSIEKIEENPERNLFLCWTPMTSFSYEALKKFKKSKAPYFIHIGEPGNEDGRGCTDSVEFFRYLNKNFTLVEDYSLPNWQGVYDGLRVYKNNLFL